MITERIVEVDARKKRDVLLKMIDSEAVKTAIIFCNRKTTVRDLAKSLKQAGLRAGEIHGDMDQGSRIKELDFFKSGEINILVASDVAARGLDIKGVSHVFNYDAPWHPDDYVHRIGRTGRAGATGAAFTFVTPADEEAIASIEKLTKHKIERVAKAVAARSETPEKPASASKAPKARAKPEPKLVVDIAEQPAAQRPTAPAQASKPKPARTAARSPQKDNGPDEGWNGPVPSFLGFKLGG